MATRSLMLVSPFLFLWHQGIRAFPIFYVRFRLNRPGTEPFRGDRIRHQVSAIASLLLVAYITSAVTSRKPGSVRVHQHHLPLLGPRAPGRFLHWHRRSLPDE